MDANLRQIALDWLADPHYDLLFRDNGQWHCTHPDVTHRYQIEELVQIIEETDCEAIAHHLRPDNDYHAKLTQMIKSSDDVNEVIQLLHIAHLVAYTWEVYELAQIAVDRFPDNDDLKIIAIKVAPKHDKSTYEFLLQKLLDRTCNQWVTAADIMVKHFPRSTRNTILAHYFERPEDTKPISTDVRIAYLSLKLKEQE